MTLICQCVHVYMLLYIKYLYCIFNFIIIFIIIYYKIFTFEYFKTFSRYVLAFIRTSSFFLNLSVLSYMCYVHLSVLFII